MKSAAGTEGSEEYQVVKMVWARDGKRDRKDQTVGHYKGWGAGSPETCRLPQREVSGGHQARR